jgi:hypothetical protein
VGVVSPYGLSGPLPRVGSTSEGNLCLIAAMPPTASRTMICERAVTAGPGEAQHLRFETRPARARNSPRVPESLVARAASTGGVCGLLADGHRFPLDIRGQAQAGSRFVRDQLTVTSS